MRAVWLTAFGGPEVLVSGDAQEPVAGPGQVVVDVAYAGGTFVETQFRRAGVGSFKLRPPAIPGNGVVVSVGADVDPAIGQRFPLERAADAHAAIEARATVGKTLLEVR
ncbi:hypothetical protein ALI22I_16905 [Saccharothrix sp. ALI-22-I]|uniref:zinc-binding dehydrogenase n=1 Tax=Saccharothrix sp. ALI-22-I TaxID=1933778 RepID=UPI00097BC405|nr:zinc-binding dehydrogenase [Saccharothrix sp. ALI-22-I]ONI89182.1 hypothetical protein ALI22I_16905 [Saccharothrix sp. ALI-22-I]